jgi:hypothetical protein
MPTKTDPIPLPSLDGFTRAELCELVRILHNGLARAHADFEALAATTRQAINVAEATIDAVAE